MSAKALATIAAVAGALLLAACSSTPAGTPASPVAPTFIPAPTSSAPAPTQSAVPGDCGDSVNLTLVLDGGKPVGTGAVLVARPDESVRIVVESDTATTLSVVGTRVSAEVLAGDGLSLCASFPRGRFPVTIGGVQVASVDTSAVD